MPDVPAVVPARRSDLGIQGLRAVAIVLMVSGHIIGAPDTGLRLPEGSGWRVANMWLESVRMPLFAALSGFVYAMRPPVPASGLPGLVRGKARRLLVPLVVVGTLFWLTQTLVPGTNSGGSTPLWRVYLFPYEHFWFLLSLFVIFLAVGVLDAAGLLRTTRALGVAVAVAAVLAVVTSAHGWWNLLSLDGALNLLPFFLLGVLLCRHGSGPMTRRGPLAAAAVATAALLGVQTWLRLPDPEAEGLGLDALGVVVGVLAVVTLVAVRPVLGRSRLLVWVGPFVFGIYLFHSFATAGTRIVLGRLGFGEAIPLVFALSLLAGIVFPILLRVTVGRVGWLSWALFGERPYRSRRERAAARAVAPAAAPAAVPSGVADPDVTGDPVRVGGGRD
ncbi:acyltransferase family protein [Cellulomonas endophytica]|uniref:acyltransferase family protein n=1 Tax=Cellulomonas endophytica TaxID=2494735 RepID=UPI0013E9866C|nr:acyltransferase [Cellulomonas endophytica]